MRLRRFGKVGRTLGALLVPAFVLASGCVTVDLEGLVHPRLTERRIQEAERRTRDKVLLLDLRGIIAEREARMGPDRTTPETFKAALNRAAKDNRIKAVVVRVDSPGGWVTASDVIHQELKRYKARAKVPVYASIMGLGASGAYYVSTAADRIYAHPTSVVGSIGVIARFPKVRGLADKVGYDEVILKTGELKDMGHPLKDMPEEARRILQATIEEMFDRFLGVCARGRPGLGSKEAVRPLADGRIFTARQALENKLIDGVGYLEDVIGRVKKAAGIRHAHVVTYRRGGGAESNIYSKAAERPPVPSLHVDLGGALGGASPGFFYLWLPGVRAR